MNFFCVFVQYPMKNREYLFVRRLYVDASGRFMLMRSRAVDAHPLAEEASLILQLRASGFGDRVSEDRELRRV